MDEETDCTRQDYTESYMHCNDYEYKTDRAAHADIKIEKWIRKIIFIYEA